MQRPNISARWCQASAVSERPDAPATPQPIVLLLLSQTHPAIPRRVFFSVGLPARPHTGSSSGVFAPFDRTRRIIFKKLISSIINPRLSAGVSVQLPRLAATRCAALALSKAKPHREQIKNLQP
jgi:hypothetical protein